MSLVSLPARPSAAYPEMPLFALDTVWFQIAGLLCNLECRHCFVSSSPSNHSLAMMSLAEVRPFLAEAAALGVRDYYFTGGEPFLNKELLPILEHTLAQGPATVLTNGTLIKASTARELRRLADASEHSLDLRISIDGWDAASNDPIRGEGSFARTLEGVARLAEVGMSPVITVSEVCAGAGSRAGRTKLLDALRGFGSSRPRLKILPLIRLGAEVTRARGYAEAESLAGVVLTAAEQDALQCGRARMVTARGVWVCPILVEHPGARLASTLRGSLIPYRLAHAACFTCREEGLTCAT